MLMKNVLGSSFCQLIPKVTTANNDYRYSKGCRYLAVKVCNLFFTVALV